MYFRSLGRIAFVVFACLAGTAAAQDAKKTAEAERAEHLAHMKAVAQSITLLAHHEQPESAVKLVEEPVLRYTDSTRDNRESSLWLWSAGGRPSAILAVEHYPQPPKGPRWLFEIASLSTDRIAAQHASDLKWTAKEGLNFAPLEDAEPPADKAPRRLIQMKAISRKFTAHESAVIEGRIELRGLASPLHRYADESENIIDGAIFVFANGTNPEVLLVLEADSAKDAPPRWRYAFAQMTGGAVSAELDGKEVWQSSEAEPPAVRASYVNGWLSAKAKGE